MKKIFIKIGIAYIAIGGLFGSILAISYAYAQFFVVIKMGWSVFSLAGLSFIMQSGYLIVISPIIKLFLWLPSLIMWFNDPGMYSFLMWLAPGFFVEKVML